MTRSVWGSSYVEWFLICTIGTILITRAYLAATGYPQIGGHTLHIAHAVWGACLLMVALVMGWLFLGPTIRVTSVVIGGIGFGLFLDEIGKFITVDNDYFFGPSAEVMYVSLVVVLVVTRVIRDFRPLDADEALANAAAIAAIGVSGGLTPLRRAQGLELADHAERAGCAPDAVEPVRTLLAGSGDRTDRLTALRVRVMAAIPRFLLSRRWVPIVTGTLLVISAIATGIGVAQLLTGGIDVETTRARVLLDPLGAADAIRLFGAACTLTLVLWAIVGRRRRGELWAMEIVRIAALVMTSLNALVNFATEGFGALVSVAIGLSAVAVLTHQINSATVPADVVATKSDSAP